MTLGTFKLIQLAVEFIKDLLAVPTRSFFELFEAGVDLVSNLGGPRLMELIVFFQEP